MPLGEYRKKRHFGRTPEPRGKTGRGRGQLYVIQKHAASRLHYDFRLELDGVLKSWAVPKGPSLDPRQRRLAVEVEDHPLDYGSFEGTIPEGEYGGGTVLLWDRGRWRPEGDPHEGLRQGKLVFELEGKKLQGGWALVRIQGRRRDDDRADGKPNWLLMKLDDEAARRRGDILAEAPTSVASGRDLPAIAQRSRSSWTGGGKVVSAAAKAKREPRPAAAPAAKAKRRPAPKSPRRTRAKATPKAKAKTKSRSSPRAASAARRKVSPRRKPSPRRPIPNAPAAGLPARPRVELATLVATAPAGDDWLHEIKLDGYRALARIERGEVRLSSRNEQNWNERFAAVARACAELDVETAILDGEIVALDDRGRSSFQALQRAMREGTTDDLYYFVFDLLYLDGRDLRRLPLAERKAALRELLPGNGAGSRLRYSDHVIGGGDRFFAAACRLGAEGVVSKRLASPYREGRGRDWLKVKCTAGQEVVIGGFTEPAGTRTGFGALLVGVYDEAGELRYAGKVGTGFDTQTLARLRERLARIERPQPAYVDPPRGAEARGVHWVDPKLVANVRFTEWTEDNLLRHPSFAGLREDKSPREVVRELPRLASQDDLTPKETPEASRNVKTAKTAKHSKNAKLAKHAKNPKPARRSEPADPGPQRSRRATAVEGEVAGIRLSHPDRVLYPEHGLRKIDLARYYEAVAERMLPHVQRRPLMLLRCPAGRGQQCFFQKHLQETPDEIERVPLREEGGQTADYAAVRDLPGLIALVQMGVLEIHTWGSRADLVERPDRLVFDLDPDPDLPWARVVAAAVLVRERLAALGLESFVKTTGGKGLHVEAPIARRHSWDEVKRVARAIAEGIAAEAPEGFLSQASKAARRGRIFVDWLRNARGATAIAPYSTRARPGAPVATPVAWDELAHLAPQKLDWQSVPKRLAGQRADPWAGYLALRQSLTRALREAGG